MPRSSALDPALRTALALAGAVLVLPALPHALAAQVGYEPARSPFQDLEYRQGLTLTGGYLAASAGRGGVGPTGGPLAGVRYDLLMAGPAWFTARVQGVASERTVIDPARDAGNRALGVEQRPLTFADVGISVALTGQKSWRGLVPMTHTGAGIVSNFAGPDVGGFKLGTRFALAYGAGVRWVPVGRRVTLRADAGWHLYQLRYPASYFQVGGDQTSVFPTGASRSSWRNNTAITVGATWQFRR